MSFFRNIFYAIKSFFIKPEPIEVKPIPIDVPPREPKAMPLPPTTESGVGFNDDDWIGKAAEIIASFEGNGIDWGNPTGNFDGAYLTCGLLGFTWKYNNQPPMILKFVSRHGESELKRLMPIGGADYIKAARLGESGGSSIVKKWSNGSTVFQPYKKELNAFWTSPGMIQIQKETIRTMMGDWGLKKMYETQKFFKLPYPKFQHLVYWMDQATLNGTGSTPTFDEGAVISINTVISFCSTVGGYNKNDMRLNGALWAKMLPTSPAEETLLLKMGYIRAKRSRSEFMGTVLNRRGTLALGKGYVNGSLRTYEWA